MVTLSSELRLAFRRFRRHWIGNTLAMFSIAMATVCSVTLGLIIQEMILADLPVPEASRLVSIFPATHDHVDVSSPGPVVEAELAVGIAVGVDVAILEPKQLEGH